MPWMNASACSPPIATGYGTLFVNREHCSWRAEQLCHSSVVALLMLLSLSVYIPYKMEHDSSYHLPILLFLLPSADQAELILLMSIAQHC